MSDIDEDDDAFLYGDGDAPVTTTEAGNSEQKTDAPATEEKKESDEGGEDNDEGDDDDEDDSDEDSDSDIEFIIGSEEPKAAAATTTTTTTTTEADAASTTAQAQTAAGVVPEAVGEVAIETDKPEENKATGASITRTAGVDINKVGEYEGQPITTINLQDLKEKPWRQPGADITEYFNYGFNEWTWTMYCQKQDKLRANYNPQKMMGGVPFMMPPMGGLPGSAPGALPAFPSFPAPPAGFPMPPAPPATSAPTTADSEKKEDMPSLPSGPAGLNLNLPRAPQRSTDYRDAMDRDMERGGGHQRDNYRDRNDRQRRGGYQYNNRRGRQ